MIGLNGKNKQKLLRGTVKHVSEGLDQMELRSIVENVKLRQTKDHLVFNFTFNKDKTSYVKILFFFLLYIFIFIKDFLNSLNPLKFKYLCTFFQFKHTTRLSIP